MCQTTRRGKLIVEDDKPDWSGRKKAAVDQKALFDSAETKLEKIPFVFKYRYRCEERDCNGHTQSIIDWELMQLYRKLTGRGMAGSDIQTELRKKYLDELCDSGKDTHFFVGNHSLFPITFMVLGVFWPPRSAQPEMF